MWKTSFLRSHKPTSFDEIIGNKHIIETLKTYISSNTLTNIIFTGNSGIGKTTCCDLLVRKYLGDKLYENGGKLYVYGTLYKSKDIVIEANDSTKSNSKYTTRNVINFIRQSENMEGKKKIVVFFDLDWMSVDTQMALRRVMEDYTDVYYIIICEDLTSIIEAIQSRSMLLHFDLPTINELYEHLINVRKKDELEGKISMDMIKYICLASQQNIRKAMIFMWILSIYDVKDEAQFQNLFGIVSAKLIKKLIMLCYKNDVKKALKLAKYILSIGFSLEDVFQSMIDVLNSCEIDDKFELRCIDIISKNIVDNFHYASNIYIYIVISQLSELNQD